MEVHVAAILLVVKNDSKNRAATYVAALLNYV
jgi:hypothetical protein